MKHERFFLLGGARVALASLPDPAAGDPAESAPPAKRTRAQHKAATTPTVPQPAASESSDSDLQLVPTLDDAFMNLDVNSWVFAQVSGPRSPREARSHSSGTHPRLGLAVARSSGAPSEHRGRPGQQSGSHPRPVRSCRDAVGGF